MQNEIQVARYSGLLHKLLDMKEGAPSPTLATDIFPMLALESDRPEWAFLAGERLCFMQWHDAAVVAEYSSLGLRNPVASGVLVVVESMNVMIATGGYALGMRGNSTVDAANPGRTRDSRTAAQATAAQMVERTQGTVPAYPMWTGAVISNTNGFSEFPVILTPGWELMIWNATVNSNITVAFTWRERALGSSETR